MDQRQRFPPVHLGYSMSIVFLAYEFMNFELWTGLIVRLSIVLAGLVYFVWHVYLIHKDVAALTSQKYQVSPALAMAKQLIPFYNIYWLYKWPSLLHEYLSLRAPMNTFSLRGVFVFLFGGILLARLDFALGYAFLWTGMVILIRHMQGLTDLPEALPPTIATSSPGDWSPELKARLYIPPEKR